MSKNSAVPFHPLNFAHAVYVSNLTNEQHIFHRIKKKNHVYLLALFLFNEKLCLFTGKDKVKKQKFALFIFNNIQFCLFKTFNLFLAIC